MIVKSYSTQYLPENNTATIRFSIRGITAKPIIHFPLEHIYKYWNILTILQNENPVNIQIHNGRITSIYTGEEEPGNN
jgi:hypothetical protein